MTRNSNNTISFKCDLCGFLKYKVMKSCNTRVGIENTKYNIVKCMNCGLLSLNPIPSDPEFSTVYENYAIKKKRMSVENQRLEIYTHKLGKIRQYTNGNKLLDIGAGLGTFVKCAEEIGFDAIGVEYEKDQCELAKKLNGVELINGKIENVCQDFTKESFDVINLHHVLEHFQSPKEILKITHNLLKPNGILLIEVPNQFYNVKKELKYYLSGKFKYPDNALHHLCFFSIKTLKGYIRMYDFEIIELNQFLPREKNTQFWERFPKDFYRYLVSKFEIGGGSFIEIYLKKMKI